MGVLRLAVCVSGVYATFLLWAIAQERLVSVPFPNKHHPARLQPASSDGSHRGDRFPSPIFLTFVQAVASSVCAFTYLCFTSWRNGTLGGRSVSDIVGLSTIINSVTIERGRVVSTPMLKSVPRFYSSDESEREPEKTVDKQGKRGQSENGGLETFGVNGSTPRAIAQAYGGEAERRSWRKTLPGLLAQVAFFQTTAGPIGFLALEHISYPTMVLGKSCKLIPVLLLNVIIYRRRFSSHKYVVVGLVTLGISLFMMLGDKKKRGGSDSMLGLTLLLINLFIDGLTNSTQDHIFATYKHFTGQQMMFIMAILTQVLLFPFLLLPLPSHPSSLLHHLPIPLVTHLGPEISAAPITFSQPAFWESIQFLFSHPTAINPLLAFACLGGLGQLFIFETIQHFGSLTLVMVTVTRKLFTMLLSVIVFNHDLSNAQWLGVAVVFSGIGVEAAMKRRDMMRRARRDPK